MVAEPVKALATFPSGCSLAKISMVAERVIFYFFKKFCCSLAKISMVAEHSARLCFRCKCCSLAKISMVAELRNMQR